MVRVADEGADREVNKPERSKKQVLDVRSDTGEALYLRKCEECTNWPESSDSTRSCVIYTDIWMMEGAHNQKSYEV